MTMDKSQQCQIISTGQIKPLLCLTFSCWMEGSLRFFLVTELYINLRDNSMFVDYWQQDLVMIVLLLQVQQLMNIGKLLKKTPFYGFINGDIVFDENFVKKKRTKKQQQNSSVDVCYLNLTLITGKHKDRKVNNLTTFNLWMTNK